MSKSTISIFLPSFILFVVCLSSCLGQSLSIDPKDHGKLVHEQVLIPTIKATKSVHIDQSAYFKRLWGEAIPLQDSFPVRGYRSLPVYPEFTLILTSTNLELISTRSGEIHRSALLPKEITLSHTEPPHTTRTSHSNPFSKFTFQLLGSPVKGIIVATAPLFKYYQNGVASTVGRAIYGCSYEGKILWTAKFDGLNSEMFPFKLLPNQDILLVRPHHSMLLAITPEGKELFRVHGSDNYGMSLSQGKDGELLVITYTEQGLMGYQLVTE